MTPELDFAAKPEAVTAVAEAHRLAFGHLFNPAFATEISSIDPLPHQRIAVYERMLGSSPLRFLLADDAGAGKTIMTGLYLREAFARRLIKRVLIIAPAGLIGNWESELRLLFRLPFKIVRGADAQSGNPFAGAGSDRVIISLDTLAGKRMFGCLREAVATGAAPPYDLTVFDEAHKLAADQRADEGLRKTGRYRLAEALAGLAAKGSDWDLGWSATHLLLLTATPHMGKDFPYYCLWRLLAPDALSTYEAFRQFPEDQRQRHFIRRTKEEMVRYDGSPLYPQRQCATLSYALSPAEQTLYDATTRYIAETYNKAQHLNRSAARLAMSVFQRRQASSTFALQRSMERRLERLDEAIAWVQAGDQRLLEDAQARASSLSDYYEEHAADEDTADQAGREAHELFEERAMAGFIGLTLLELREERAQVEALLAQAKQLADASQDSKFAKLQAIMQDPAHAGEKLIIFTEHRDTAMFLVNRFKALGHAGRVALIHGGQDYKAREMQVESFRRPGGQGGSDYLVATDAAGEGINLQFCWRMVNYDIPWNPARLEQRMGRIHRYGQQHDPVVIVNLVAGETREGRVLKTLLDKLELIRAQLRSDKVFDVIGRIFEGLSLKGYLEMAATDDGAAKAIADLDGRLTTEQVQALGKQEQARYGDGEVKAQLPALAAAMETEQYRHLLPGYIRSFVETAAPLLGLQVADDASGVFQLIAKPAKALGAESPDADLSPLLAQQLTVHRPKADQQAAWLHPGEALFDRLRAALLASQGAEALRGAIFVDPYAEAPYLFHLVQVSVLLGDEVQETRPLGLRQAADGAVTTCSLEHLLLLRGAPEVAPGSQKLAGLARGLTQAARDWARDVELARLVAAHQERVAATLPQRQQLVAKSYDLQAADLLARRQALAKQAKDGGAQEQDDLQKIKAQQDQLQAEKQAKLALLATEAERIHGGEIEMLAHALVVPTDNPEERQRHDAEVEAIAMQLARSREEAEGATVTDVSTPALATAADLNNNPGFDLLSKRPAKPGGKAETRAIEVKGRAGTGAVRLSRNEWASACNQGESYWLYVAFECASSSPRLHRIQDPFRKLLAQSEGGVVVSSAEILAAADESEA